MTDKSNIKTKAKDIGWTLLGFAIFAGFILLGAALFWGTTKVSAFLYPMVNNLSELAIAAFVILVLPLSLFNKLRPFLASTSIVLSWIIGATIWMFSFLVIVGYSSWVALFCLLFFRVVAPIAIIGLLINKQWVAAIGIFVGLLFTYGIRIYAAWLISLCDRSGIQSYVAKEPVNSSLPLYCPKCGKGYDGSWKVCLDCSENLLETTVS